MSYYRIVGGDPDLDALSQVGQGRYRSIVGGMSDDPAIVEAALARNAIAVQEAEPRFARRFPLGFVSPAVVAGGASTTIISQPQLTYRPERFVVPSDIAGAFTIDDLQVGQKSQFANSVTVPARIFDEQAVAVVLRQATAQTSQNVTVQATNISGAGVTFRAAMIGTALEN